MNLLSKPSVNVRIDFRQFRRRIYGDDGSWVIVDSGKCRHFWERDVSISSEVRWGDCELNEFDLCSKMEKFDCWSGYEYEVYDYASVSLTNYPTKL